MHDAELRTELMHTRHSKDMPSGIKALYKLIWRAEAEFSSAFVSSFKDQEKNIIFLNVVQILGKIC